MASSENNLTFLLVFLFLLLCCAASSAAESFYVLAAPSPSVLRENGEARELETRKQHQTQLQRPTR
jgi:hypothetical protein